MANAADPLPARSAYVKRTWAVLVANDQRADQPLDQTHCYTLPQISAGNAYGILSAHDVYFYTTAGPGITLSQALLGQHDNLEGRNDVAFSTQTEIATKISLEIQLQGHGRYTRQVTVLRATSGAESLPLGRLAQKIATETRASLNNQEVVEIGGHAFSFEEIFLWKLHRAKKGTWQPEFYVRI